MEQIHADDVEPQTPDRNESPMFSEMMANVGDFAQQPVYTTANGGTAMDVSGRTYLYFNPDKLRQLADMIEAGAEKLQE